MKVLWIVNTIFPAPSEALALKSPIYGGWMYGLADSLGQKKEIQLAVATTYLGTELKVMVIDNITYYLIPSKKNFIYQAELESYWEIVNDQFKPDIIHVHGTEFAHGLLFMRRFPELKYVISIQGLVSVCADYFYASMSYWDIFKSITLKDIIRLSSIYHQKKNFQKRGRLEHEYICRTKDVIGRTSWDYAHTKHINPKLNYHFCNESLRNGFYEAEKWTVGKMEKHSIFLSQASYPLKGLHQVIKAVSDLKKDYPTLKIKIGGPNIINTNTFLDKIKLSGYGNYIKQLLLRYQLIENVVFLGELSEAEIINEYQKSHVFICPSSIENSPNSLGEAQLLGVPLIAAYVGGVPDMVEHRKTGLLYRFEETEMLKESIRNIFESPTSVLSNEEIVVASNRHNRETNLIKLLTIYDEIVTRDN